GPLRGGQRDRHRPPRRRQGARPARGGGSRGGAGDERHRGRGPALVAQAAPRPAPGRRVIPGSLLVLVNPAAGGGGSTEPILEAAAELRAEGHLVEVRQTTAQGEARRIAAREAASFDRVA